MRHFIAGIAMFLLCGFSVVGQDPSDFNPNNPPEPKATFTLTLNSDSAQAGTVTGGGTYYVGDQVLLTATPSIYHVFVAWMEGPTVVSTQSSFQYTIPDRSVSLTAKFEYRKMYPLTLETSPANLGSTGGGGYYEEGTTVNVTTYVAGAYNFKGWWDGNQMASDQQTFDYVIPNHPVQLVARYEYNPSNPGEPNSEIPKHKLYLMSSPPNGGNFSQSSGVEIRERDSLYLYTNANTSFVFDGWYHKGSLYKTANDLYFTMGTSNDTLTARFHYDPSSPGEPNPGSTPLYHLTAISQTAASGSKLAFPIFLGNENMEVRSAIFEATFPAGVVVDYTNVSLSSRSNGHELTCDTLGGNQFRFTVSNDSSWAFSGTSGILLTIPVTLPSEWLAGSSYPVLLSNATIGTSGGTVTCPVKNGTIGVTPIVSNLYASFYTDVHLNRVLFSNMSSESAKTSLWKFGDGQTSTEKNPMHVYAASGSYDVVLTVSDGTFKDSIRMSISITDEANWLMEGYYTLGTTRNNVKNFTTGPDLFKSLAKCKITGNIFIQVEPGKTFDTPLDSSMNAYFSQLGAKILKDGGPTLTFLSEKADSVPLIDFSGVLNKTYVGNVLETATKFRFNKVNTAFSGMQLNITALHGLTDVTTCSGHQTPEVDLSVIGNQFDIRWLVVEKPEAISGQVDTGSIRIPSMRLVNDTVAANILVYSIQLVSEGYLFHSGEFRYHVLASLRTAPTPLAPASNAMLEIPQVTFNWQSQDNASYDLFLWEDGTPMPDKPLVSGIWSAPYTDNRYCQYGKAYKWKILARNTCDSLWSRVDSFHIGQLPDLKVESITLSQLEIYAGESMDVQVRVRNIGGKVYGNTWGDQLYLVYGKNQQNRLSVASTWKWQKILSDSSYLVDFHVMLPLDTIRYTDFLFVADYGLNLPEISKLNNTLYSDTLVVKHYLIEETDYKLLKLLHEQTGGTQWNTKWKTSTNLLIAGNWPGVGFEKGRVVSIDLNHNNLRGKIPHGIFQLPQLRSLSLNNNRLTGQLEVLADSLKRNNIRCDSLNLVNLGYNLLSGEVSAFANRFPNLTGLNLESNQFNRIDSLLSKKITTLNLQNQVFSHSEIPLSMNPALSIPSLFRYRHDTQELNRTDLYFNLYKNGNYLGWINFRDARFALRLNAEWSYASRDSFDLIQSNSYLYGCKTKLRLNFKPGDANIDERTDILDVQQTLNRVLVENPYPFNRVAANTFADNQITVQDIVSTVNLLLQSGVVVDSTQLAGSTPKSGNVLFIADGKIMMDVQEPVSALDLSLTNISDQQIDVLLNSDDFQSLARNTAEGVRVIVFSGTGKEIPAGLTPLANLRAPTAEVVGATLANKQANSVSVQITREPTYQRDLTTSDYSVYLGKHNIILQLKENVGQLTAELINLQGVLIDRREMNQLTVGSHTIDYTDNLSTGAYLLKLTFRNGDSVQTRNFKWIVSK